MRRLFNSLFRANDGAATLELAIILPVFATMLIGVVDITTAFNRKLELEQAVQRSIERVMQTTTDQTVEENIKAEASAAAGIPVGNVTVTYTLTCNGATTPPDEDCPVGQTEMRYTKVRATTVFTPMFPLSRIGIARDNFTLVAENAVRTS